MIDFCTVVVLDFELKKVYLQANSLQADRTKTFFCPFKCDSGPFRTSGDLLSL